MSFVDELIERAAPDPEFTLSVAGTEFRFRSPVSADGYLQMARAARKFARKFSNPEVKPPEAWQPFIVRDVEALVYVWILAECSIEPKLTHLDGLKLASQAYPLFQTLRDGFDEHSTGNRRYREAKELEEAKRDFLETPEPGSEPPPP